jgi:hypothetical protein
MTTVFGLLRVPAITRAFLSLFATASLPFPQDLQNFAFCCISTPHVLHIVMTASLKHSENQIQDPFSPQRKSNVKNSFLVFVLRPGQDAFDFLACLPSASSAVKKELPCPLILLLTSP